MPIAAVPRYLGSDFCQASPGLRFGLYLAVWTTRKDQESEVLARSKKESDEGRRVKQWVQTEGMSRTIERLCTSTSNPLPCLWGKNKAAAQDTFRHITDLTQSDQARMKALACRQGALGSCVPATAILHLEAQSVTPFTTGLGNEHPLENGFAFLNPYGLPYLPGSGVKGVLRQAARELASGEWEGSGGWSIEAKYEIQIKSGESEPEDEQAPAPLRLDMIDVLFGRDTSEKSTAQFRGVLTFWDVFPQIHADRLFIEIMTPHQSHYYQRKPEAGSMSPHESGQPNPICFLTVPPESKFEFYVVCDVERLKRVAPDLSDKWKGLLEKAFDHAFRWLGFGAKTAVGYGAMVRAKPPQVSDMNRLGSESERKSSPSTRRVVWDNATLIWNPGQGTIIVSKGDLKSAPVGRDKSDQLFRELGEEKTAELKKKKHLERISVLVEQQGNKYIILRIESA